MLRSELVFDYPEKLIATSPARPTRVFFSDGSGESELKIPELLEKFGSNDVLVINDSKVIPRRVKALSGEEVLFLDELGERRWQVLFPARGRKPGDSFKLPGDVQMTLLEKGLPQCVEVDQEIGLKWFETFGELPLPPYIQKMRDERGNHPSDREWYQSDWAEKNGSLAAPTASLHFQKEDFLALQGRGVQILKITLHVGLGTFLPIKVDDLKEHKMHREFFSMEPPAFDALREAVKQGKKVTALGTTVARVLETFAQNDFSQRQGETDIFLYPPYQFQVVNQLMTNFHQPESTLLALVSAFAGRERVLKGYQWAIEKEFRLFSYGDLSVWNP